MDSRYAISLPDSIPLDVGGKNKTSPFWVVFDLFQL